MPAVPKYSVGSAIGPPEPRSSSFWSSVGASWGAKNCEGAICPSAPTVSPMTDSDSVGGGSLEGAGVGETPLPVARMIRPGMSETSPPPLCQTPASEFSSAAGPLSSLHIVVIAPLAALKPATMPR